jgi:hypothetical protein
VAPWQPAHRCTNSPSPSATSALVLRSDWRYATTSHRCWGVSVAAHAGIIVPATPTDATRYRSAGDAPAFAAASPIGAGGGWIVFASGPSPIPRVP